MTWDSLKVTDWSKAADPAPFIIIASTDGCGCCGDSAFLSTKQEAVECVRTYIVEREEELAQWREWLKRMESAEQILPLP